MKTISINDATFKKEVLDGKVVTLVDFWAPWCGPCKMIAPTLDRIAVEYDDSVRVVKLNVDENPVTAQRYQIRSIPTLLFFKEGKIIDQIIGAVSVEQIRSRIDTFL